MSVRMLNIALFLGLAAVVGVNWLAGRDLSQPNVEFLPEMVHSIPYDAYAFNPNFDDGMTLREPVEGTIVRGSLPIHYSATPEDAVRAGEELINPFASDDQDALTRGAFVYAAFCQPCHGAKGLGDGPVAQRGFPPPPSLVAEKALSLRDGQIFHIITYGQGNMPSHASQLKRRDRWMAIMHVRSLQSSATTKSAEEKKP